ncbi:MAG: hypothetical protein ABJC36_07205 [Gemmatimonadales bacterium]
MSLKILVLVLAFNGFAGCSSATAGDDLPTRSVLFVGNSLTYTNDLPALVAQVAGAAEDSVRVGMAAGPNLAVIDHTNGATDAVAQIHEGDWGFVVLQQGPTPAGICRDTLVIAAMRLAPHVRAAGGRVVLFLPWTRQSSLGGLAVATESGTLAARAVGGVTAPVGLAWKLALEADPSLPLYGPDGYHPAPAGSLLAALTIYERVFGRDVREIPAAALAALPAGPLTPAHRQLLAMAAHTAATSLSPDPATAVPADTTHRAPGSGPC